MENSVKNNEGRRHSTIGILLASLFAISACSENSERIFEASNTGGDYAVLDCEELRVAQLSIDQRLGTSSTYSTVGEPTILLQVQGETIAPIRQTRDCPTDPALNGATPSEVVANSSDTDLVEDAFLQVATFREVSNLNRFVAKLSNDGFPVQVLPITLAGSTYNRVVVGPLTTVSEIARIDAAVLRMGLSDAFFLKQ